MKKIPLLLLTIPCLLSFSGKVKDEFQYKEIEKSLVLIPARSIHYGMSDQDVPYPGQQKSRVVSVDSFYLSKYEVSNAQYLAFVSEIRKTDNALYLQMLPDTLVWREKQSFCEPMVDYYFRHPAYRNFPVVGVSYQQASYFCTWLTQKYQQQEKRKFKNATFQLPSTEEWTLAANGKLSNPKFPWEGNSLQNKKGEWMACFRAIPQEGIAYERYELKNNEGKIVETQVLTASGWGTSNNNFQDIVSPVQSYPPNGYGLLNMAGNVEEFVRQKGITKGGSWKDTGYYLQNNVEEYYDTTRSASSERGFRFAMKVMR